MAQITEKELGFLGDLMTAEQLQIAKYCNAAKSTQDKAIAECYTRMAERHQRSFDKLYADLK
jgi:hypothetical protein